MIKSARPFRGIRPFFLLIFILSFAALPLRAAENAFWSGKVVHVSDGDSFIVLKEHDGKYEETRIRLAWVDAPELDQPYGRSAKRFTSGLIAGKKVWIKSLYRDRYGRIVGEVFTPGGKSLDEELLRAGMAWQYTRYSNSQRLAALEREARDLKKGLWADPNPIPPYLHQEKTMRGGDGYQNL